MKSSYINSSNLSHAKWENRVLTLTFKHGGAYTYPDVPESVYDSLVTAESAGKFFHAEIRNKYEGTKVPV